MTDEQAKKLDLVYDEVKEISTALRGYNGYMGVLERVSVDTKDIQSLKTCYEGVAEAVKDIDPLKKDVQELKQAPGRLSIKAWVWVLGVIGAIIIAVASSITTAKVEAASKQPVSATTSASVNPAGKGGPNAP